MLSMFIISDITCIIYNISVFILHKIIKMSTHIQFTKHAQGPHLISCAMTEHLNQQRLLIIALIATICSLSHSSLSGLRLSAVDS